MKEFTADEIKFAELNDKLHFYARDKYVRLFGYVSKPEKAKSYDYWKSNNRCIELSDYTSLEFNAIKWEDEEPTSREEILASRKED